MEKKEFATFAMALRTYYPREQLLPNQQAMELWFRELCDIPYNVAEAALRKWVVNNKWSPSIADIREMTSSIQVGDIPDWGEAWEQVRYAIRMYGSYEPRKALDSLPELARTATERIGYINLCMSENISTERANFRMIYEQLAQRKKQDANIPKSLLSLIDKIRIDDGLMIGGEDVEGKRISASDQES